MKNIDIGGGYNYEKWKKEELLLEIKRLQTEKKMLKTIIRKLKNELGLHKNR
jgi:hypothetical protein